MTLPHGSRAALGISRVLKKSFSGKEHSTTLMFSMGGFPKQPFHDRLLVAGWPNGILGAAAPNLVELHGATGLSWSSVFHLLAVKVMRGVGIGSSGFGSKHICKFRRRPVQTMIIVCSEAARPVFLVM